MKFIKNLLIALCGFITIFVITSCDSEDTDMFSYNSLSFVNGSCIKEMIVGETVGLPSERGEKPCSWVSDNPTVATIINEDSKQKMKADGIGEATVSDENTKLKIYVTVKENKQ